MQIKTLLFGRSLCAYEQKKIVSKDGYILFIRGSF